MARYLIAFCLLGTPETAHAEWFLGAFGGAGHTQPGSLALVQPARETELELSPVNYRSDSWRPPIYYGVRLSFLPFPISSLGVEAEFIHLKVIAKTEERAMVGGRIRGTDLAREEAPINRFVQRFSLTHGLNFVLANVVTRVPLRTSAGSRHSVMLLGRIGGGFTVPHVESTIGGVDRERYERGRAALQVTGGAEIKIVERLYLTTEYKFTRSRQCVSVGDGIVRGLFKTHHGVVGIAVRVGS